MSRNFSPAEMRGSLIGRSTLPVLAIAVKQVPCLDQFVDGQFGDRPLCTLLALRSSDAAIEIASTSASGRAMTSSASITLHIVLNLAAKNVMQVSGGCPK